VNRLFIVAQVELAKRLSRELEAEGFSCYVAARHEDVSHIVAEVVLIEVELAQSYQQTEELFRSLKLERHLPLLALVSKNVLTSNASELKTLPCDDFVLEPYDRKETLLRVRKLIGDENHAVNQQIVSGDLLINTTQAEVFLNGRAVELTFREYELLRFLASHPGRMYSRDALLNHVWGYDYLGGDRTVDVHIRRLRSKIEDAEHSFIDTVRNMGYRFRKQV
jgi:two-component system, OmpR family, alkaline phosphatase synthesis response regulator PhoP